MKKLFVIVLSISLAIGMASIVWSGANDGCTTIKEGLLTYSSGHYLDGEPLRTGFDPFGYNYQARKFMGSYANAYLGRYGFPPYEGDDEAYLAANPDAVNSWVWPYRNDALMMKWNDAWLDNKDCDTDSALDRFFGYSSYIGSGAWLTNHMSGTYEENGKECDWSYFVKIVAAPSDAYVDSGFWYAADGTQIGEVIWGSFAIVQQVERDSCSGVHGAQYISPIGPGFGQFKE